jgi:hypothetical protein
MLLFYDNYAVFCPCRKKILRVRAGFATVEVFFENCIEAFSGPAVISAG